MGWKYRWIYNEKKKIVAIIDNISIGEKSGSIDGKYANPALYFFKRGPRYETWLSSVKLARQLNVPHFLFTIDKVNPEEEHIGFTKIEKLTKNGIFYEKNKGPNENILEGLNNILLEIEKALKNTSVPIID